MEDKSKKRRPRRTFTDEFKAGAVALVLDEQKAVAQVADDLDLSQSVLRGWMKQASACLDRILAQVEVAFSNSLIEAYWRSLKHQWLFLNTLDTATRGRALVEFYINEHNAKMPHPAFGGQTPDEMFFGTGAKVPEELALANSNAWTARLAANVLVRSTLKIKLRSAGSAAGACVAGTGGSREDVTAGVTSRVIRLGAVDEILNISSTLDCIFVTSPKVVAEWIS